MNIYGVYLSHYVYEVAWFKDLVKIFANENDANTYADEMNKMVREKTDSKFCASCEWSSILDNEEFELTFANGDTEQIDCDPSHGNDPEFFVKEMELN